MKYVDEYRRAEDVQALLRSIAATLSRPWTLMEICGGQTHSILQSGLDRLLPPAITLVHGPGCPVCVTPLELIDRALAIARRPEVVFASFGDMLRVPGSSGDLLGVKSEGGDVRILYSPLDAVGLAERNPDRQVVFFAVGFETTAPANAMAVWRAAELGLENFTILSAHVRVPPALEIILSSPENRVQGVLAAGHVCTVMGTREYEPLAARHRVPITVTGFEPVDLLRGIEATVVALEAGLFGVKNRYRRAVTRDGNPAAVARMREVFVVCDRAWRGIGTIPESGLALAPAYAGFDAVRRFGVADVHAEEPTECIAGEILQGRTKPPECPAFGTRCTPDHPLGAPMVSAEGACAAYHRYGRHPA